MGSIKELNEELIKQIAAGEVIERPASVVKELIENSIDAKSTKIEIEIERSGKLIRVSDNGSGIQSDDISLLFKKHATSKLKTIDDLWDLTTLGFRGEALASIGSVSKVTCKSKNINEEIGFELKYINGKIEKKSSSISMGTIFEIDDLFYNIPARQKFLKSEQTEVSHIYDIVLSEAIIHPEISFKLTSNKKKILESSGSGSLSSVIVETLGEDLKNNLIEISSKNNSCVLSGLISSLEIVRTNKKYVFVYVNNRPIKCSTILKAVSSAYENLLAPGKFPVIVLNLDFKPGLVDINVHPTKKEVRYTNQSEAYNFVLNTIQNTISNFYKEKYKNDAVYKLPEVEDISSLDSSNFSKGNISYEKKQFSPPTEEHLQAALDFYKPYPEKENLELSEPTVEIKKEKTEQVFNLNNLKCYVIISNKPIANMTKIGNKTIFEVGMIYENDVQIVFSGEAIGDQIFQKDLFNALSKLSPEIFKSYTSNQIPIQERILNEEFSEEEKSNIKRKKPLQSLLYKVWERDNWTCVYCEKQLIDPNILNEVIPKAKNAFITYINNSGKEVTSHILKEHAASYDHYLPASKLPQFNNEYENLFTSCIECNRKKSNSLDLSTWKPVIKNNWGQPLELAGITFKTPKTYLDVVEK